jgi:hypothetical protein
MMTDSSNLVFPFASDEMTWNSHLVDSSNLATTLSSSCSSVSSLCLSSKRKSKPYRYPKRNSNSPGIIFKFPAFTISKHSGEVAFGDFMVVSYPPTSTFSRLCSTNDSKVDTSTSSRKKSSLKKAKPLYNEDEKEIYTYLSSASPTSSFITSHISSSPIAVASSLKPARSKKMTRKEPKNSVNPTYLGKRECGACGTKKTPYWRDGWDGLYLCNACGIRYHKYHIYCKKCKYVPRKEERGSKYCIRCHEWLL